MSDYQRGWRRMLVDMEIPGWDDGFLADYDPVAMADNYARAGLASVMFSCKALTGLCFWPTRVGVTHPGLRGRDVIGETVEALAQRGIAACAYYSVIYDNWAFENNPDWAVEPVGGWRAEGSEHDRHGLCCPNNLGYRGYVTDQIADLYGRYEFGSAFCDMTFWSHVCGCSHCRDRYRAEAGAEFPETIDWTAGDWCAFQAARERWIDDFTGLVTGAMRAARPDIAVYHNFAIGPIAWTRSVPFSVTEHSDFLGGDMYGDDIEQVVVTKLMNNLSRSRPVEYMTFATTGNDEHVRLKSLELMRRHALLAAADSAACMFIDAIDPAGTANPKVYERVGEAFEAASPFEPYLGGDAIEDVAVYFSDDSKMDFAENGTPLIDLKVTWADHPHLFAVRGACRVLQRAHIPFGVITRRQLANLDRYRVLVLPKIARMGADEVEAIREYVRGGGRVYASGYTSLVESGGVRHEDFMLADVFGVHLEQEEPGRIVYAKPATPRMAALIDPQRYLSANPMVGSRGGELLRLRAEPETQMLATLSLPYAHPDMGDVSDHRWASMHSSPPWEDTSHPAIVENTFGSGRAIYSAFDLEREEADVNDRLFAGIVGDLLGEDWSLRCEADPHVWATPFRHPEDGTIRVALLNAPPAVVSGAELRVRAPRGSRFVGLTEAPSGNSVPFQTEPDGTLSCSLTQVPELTMLLARYEADE